MSEPGPRRFHISCIIRRETEKAWLIDAGEKEEIWIPKSQCEMYTKADGTCECFAEEWILKAKGLI